MNVACEKGLSTASPSSSILRYKICGAISAPTVNLHVKRARGKKGERSDKKYEFEREMGEMLQVYQMCKLHDNPEKSCPRYWSELKK